MEGDYFGAFLLEHGANGVVGVHHVRLAGQGDVVDDLGDLAADDLLENFRWLGAVLVGHLGQFDFLFLGEEISRHVVRGDVRRIHRSHVHGDATGQFIGTALDFGQHANATTVQVAGDMVAAVDADHAAQLQVFADLGDQRAASFFDRAAAREGRSLQCVDISGAAVQGNLGDSVGESEEVLVLGDEVGFAVDLDQHGLAAGLRHHDATFGGDAIGLLVSLGQALLAQPFDRRVHVAVVLGKCLFALHHAGAGTLAQFLDHLGGDIH